MPNDISLFDAAVGVALSSRLVDFSNKFQIIGSWQVRDRGILYFYYGRHRFMLSVDVHSQPNYHHYYADYFRMDIAGKFCMAWSERVGYIHTADYCHNECFGILIDDLCGSIRKIMIDNFEGVRSDTYD